MILYNTSMAVAAGAGLLSVAFLGHHLWRRRAIAAEGWSLLFGILGTILTVLGFAVTISWPYNVAGVLDANILFGEPSVAFGLLLLAAAIYLWHGRALFVANGSASKAESDAAFARIISVLRPVSIFIFATGLVMAACAISWIRYRLGAAPPTEPISGRFSNMPVLESTFMGVLYGIIALGALLAPFGLKLQRRKNSLVRVVYVCWIVGGAVLLLFGTMNFYTHIGSLQNETTGTHYKY